mgnify:CR=1 FL=1
MISICTTNITSTTKNMEAGWKLLVVAAAVLRIRDGRVEFPTRVSSRDTSKSRVKAASVSAQCVGHMENTSAREK